MTVFVLSCSHQNESIIIIVSSEPGDVVIVENTSNSDLRFNILINSLNPSSDLSLFKEAGGDFFTTKSLDKIIRIFNFVCEHTYHKDYKVSSNSFFKPSVAISSMGGGLCSVRSGVLTNLLRMNGFVANTYVLTGHAVTVVYYDGRDLVFDPDFGLWYYNDEGQIATYHELCSNPNLITHPINPVLDKTDVDFFIAYSVKVSDFYSTVDNNYVLNTIFPHVQGLSSEYSIPKGSVLKFPVVPAINPNRFGIAILEIPAGVTGSLYTPFAVSYISGNCVVENKQSVKEIVDFRRFNDADLLFGEINVVKNLEGIKIYYFLNPLLFCNGKSNEIRLEILSPTKPNVQVKSSVSDELAYCVKNDMLDSIIRVNIVSEYSEFKDLDEIFDLFFNNCKSDSNLNMYFFWDSLLFDYKGYFINQDLDEITDYYYEVHPELFRRFLAKRFDEKFYFLE